MVVMVVFIVVFVFSIFVVKVVINFKVYVDGDVYGRMQLLIEFF